MPNNLIDSFSFLSVGCPLLGSRVYDQLLKHKQIMIEIDSNAQINIYKVSQNAN